MYMQMASALALTGVTAFVLSESSAFMNYLFFNPWVWWVCMIAQFGLVLLLSARVMRMSTNVATLVFVLYSMLTGVTLSTIFMVYSMGTIATTFFVTAGTFLAMSLIGYFTKMDLTKMGNILHMLLIGLVIATVVNLFVASSGLDWIINYVGVLIFVGLTAYDTQKIKQIFYTHGAVDESGYKMALLGALTLYLDFINLFLFLLRILGGSRN
jgi:FtsH-binding integral membrane protein